MGIFDFLKPKPTNVPKTEITEQSEKQKTAKSIYELFNLDIKSSPDDSFIIGNSEINESGNKIVNYRKT